MGSRLSGFDYSRPYFYMVTIRRNDGYPALSRVCGDVASHYLAENWITRLFVDIIMTFHETWYCIEPIRCFSIMPDHIHLLIKIRDIEKRVSLAVIVRVLARALEKAYFALAGASAGRTPTDAKGAATGAGGRSGADARSGGQHLFAFDWHDWIVKADGQLAAFTRYIRENPERSWRRQSHREYFQRVNEVPFLGRKWYGYGNAEILKSPILEPMRYSLWPAMAREPTKAEIYDRCHLMGDIIVDGLGKQSLAAAG